jgi:hypothetical protein
MAPSASSWKRIAPFDQRRDLEVARQQLQQFETAKAGSPVFMKSQYSYYEDGRIKYAKDFGNDKFDRAYSFDHVGRMEEAYSGTQARDFINQTNTTPISAPYRQTYQYNVWSNLTSNNGQFWGENFSFSDNYNNGRRQGWEYDQAGNLANDGQNLFSYDAAGRNISTTQYIQGVDGDGVVVQYSLNCYLRSTVLGGQLIAEINNFPTGDGFPKGKKRIGFVYAGSREIAEQQYSTGIGPPSVVWLHANPVTGALGTSYANGDFYHSIEPDPSGGNVGVVPWSENPPTPSSPDLTILIGESGGGGLQSPKTLLDGVEVPWQIADSLIKQGAAVVAPTETARRNSKTGRLEFWRAYTDGTQGWAGFKYIPGGGIRMYETNPDGSNGRLIDVLGEGPDKDFHPDYNSYGAIGSSDFGGGRFQSPKPKPPKGFVFVTLVSEAEKKPTKDQCDGIRELLKRENELGTIKASEMSSRTYGGRTMIESLDNVHGNVPYKDGHYKELDIDWLMDLNVHRSSVPYMSGVTNNAAQMQTHAIYIAGKLEWDILKLWEGGTTTNPIPFQDPGEGLAVYYAETRRSYSSIFTNAWMKANCPK